MDLSSTKRKQLWVRAFWGFDPENEGYYGFTHLGQRDSFLKEARDGDWVLIYGGANEETAAKDEGQALGFLEISRELCDAKERMSDASYEARQSGRYSERWGHGLKVKRAWRLRHNLRISHIIREAADNKYRFTRGSKGVLLTEDESDRALSYPVSETSVFGEPPISAASPETKALGIFMPSKGIKPSFGKREYFTEDGNNDLYLMRFSGSAELLLGSSGPYKGKDLFKVGRSNDPKRRLAELNAGFPPPSIVKWKLLMTHKFSSAEDAHTFETELKEKFARAFQSVAGEFFVGAEMDVVKNFQEHCYQSAIIIKGAPGKQRLS